MGEFIDLTGRKFGRLTVIEKTINRKNGSVIWKCQCDCKNMIDVNGRNLRDGITQSCGCLNSELSSQRIYNLHFDNTVPCLLTSKISKANKSGIKGIWFEKETKKWRTSICLKRKVHNLGRYEKLEDAIKARKQAEEELFQPIIEEYNQQDKG